MSFMEFRRQLRLHAAMERLAAGQPVSIVAHDLGFSTTANLIAMFRPATGTTPRAYFSGPG
jgi:AraC-like DNA-binding protein